MAEDQIQRVLRLEQEQALQDFMWEKSAYMPNADKQNYVAQLKLGILQGDCPRNKSEFWHCVKALFNIEIPWAVTEDPTSEHSWISPLDWMWNVFSGKWEYSFAWANRAGGKTFMLAILDYMLATFKDNYEIVHCGGVKVQAQITQKYLAQFVLDPVLKSALVKNGITKLRAEWMNHSTWQIVTGSFRGVSGQHPACLSNDEIMLWESPEALQQTLKVPVPYKDEPGRWVSASTNQRSFGCVTWLLDNAKERNIHVAKWSALESMQPCKSCVAIDENPYGTDTDRTKSCLLWEVCRGKRGIRARGWQPREEVIKDIIKLGGIESNEVRTQILCLKPSTKGNVLYNFSHEPKALGGNLTNITYDYNHELPFYVSYDPAEGKCSVLGFWHYYEPTQQSFLFDELIQDDCPNATHAKMAFYEHCKKKGYAKPLAVIVDPRKSDSIADWRMGTDDGEGLNCFYNAIAPSIEETDGGQTIRTGINELRGEISNGAGQRKLFVNATTCPRVIQAIKQHHYPTDNANNIISDNPAPEYKDEVDMMRYWVRFKKLVLDGSSFDILSV